MARRKRKGGLPHGFVSKAQWRFFFANPKLRRFAHKEAHKAQAFGGGPKVAFHKLPGRKSAPGARTVAFKGKGAAARGGKRVKTKTGSGKRKRK